MAQQAVTRKSSAVRKRHAAHPTHPKPAAKPGEPSSAHPGGRRRAGHAGHGGAGADSGGRDGETSEDRRGEDQHSEDRRGDGQASEGRGGDDRGGEDQRGESRLGAFLAEKRPQLPAVGDLSLPKPQLPKPHLSIWARLAGKILKKIARHELRRLTDGKHWSLESVAGDEVAELRDRLGEITPGVGMLKPQLPIQEAVDVAVPLDFAWSQWMELQFLPEGVDRIVEIERDGAALSGRLDGEPDEAWSAEVLDERECESFAWKSTEGSDCAGLVTFHSLSERLTRLELTLDVLPTDLTQSALLLSHVAHARARRELRRFKADLELVSPDVYSSDAGQSR